jgi:hypothetical protein
MRVKVWLLIFLWSIFLLSAGLLGQSPNFALPDESAGIDHVVQTLISAFDRYDLIALGESHGRFPKESVLQTALVRNPDFAKKVRYIMVEFGSTTE